ncbi:hypothetical protein B0G73_1336 [Paraburkholderia sp. BL25I1N1]|nr:hypothetical protein B0G73_1336 [Paraburkholderia sp. BL25I1N1]
MASGIAARYADAFRCNARKRRPDCERPLLHQASASGLCNCLFSPPARVGGLFLVRFRQVVELFGRVEENWDSAGYTLRRHSRDRISQGELHPSNFRPADLVRRASFLTEKSFFFVSSPSPVSYANTTAPGVIFCENPAISISCLECNDEDGLPHESQPPSTWEFTDGGRYVSECPQGDQALVDPRQQKYEALFQIGAYATEDGYYREPVSSFAASLERFYEVCARCHR